MSADEFTLSTLLSQTKSSEMFANLSDSVYPDDIRNVSYIERSTNFYVTPSYASIQLIFPSALARSIH